MTAATAATAKEPPLIVLRHGIMESQGGELKTGKYNGIDNGIVFSFTIPNYSETKDSSEVKKLFQTLVESGRVTHKKMAGKICIAIEGKANHDKVTLYHVGSGQDQEVEHTDNKLAALDAGGHTNKNDDDEVLTLKGRKIKTNSRSTFFVANTTTIFDGAQDEQFDAQQILTLWTVLMDKNELKGDDEWKDGIKKTINDIPKQFDLRTVKLYAYTPKFSQGDNVHSRWLFKNSDLRQAALQKGMQLEFEPKWGGRSKDDEYTALFNKNGKWTLTTNINKYNQIADYQDYDEKDAEQMKKMSGDAAEFGAEFRTMIYE